tara:strand:- start:300 stop:578 length:279 start_codon:yes stop_codon:yes gene_type:complete
VLEPNPDLEEHLEHARDLEAFYGVSCRLGTTAFDFILLFYEEVVSKLTCFFGGGMYPTLDEELTKPYGLCFLRLEREFKEVKVSLFVVTLYM